MKTTLLQKNRTQMFIANTFNEMWSSCYKTILTKTG